MRETTGLHVGAVVALTGRLRGRLCTMPCGPGRKFQRSRFCEMEPTLMPGTRREKDGRAVFHI